MNSFLRSLLFGLCLVSATSAHAQRADIASNPPPKSVRVSAPTPPDFTVHNSGSAKAVLVPFGPYITQTGVGGGGADVSELYTTFTLGSMGYNIFGYGMQSSLSIHVADDFTVCASRVWNVSSIKWLCYQTAAATTGTITSVNLNLWNNNPLGQLPGGQSTTGPSNAFQSNSWTGVYRVLDSGLTATNRAIIQASCNGAWVPTLSSGTYWLEASAGGTLTSGPWAAIQVIAGQIPPTGNPWSGLQSVSSGAFAQVYDTGNPAGTIIEPADFLWQIEGTSGTSFSTFCTSKTSSLGCVPTLTSSSASVSKSGAPATTLTASPVPGGAGLPGILIYAKTPPVSPIVTSFGFLCLSGFARAGAFPATPGGSAGSCSGTYNWNLAAIAAGTASINVGDSLRIQGWYRDPGFPPPGNADFTHGIEVLTVTPDVGDNSCTNPPLPPNPLTVSPSGGGQGTVIAVGGLNFGTNPGDLKLLLADGNGFADVTAASGSRLFATVFQVGNTGVGPITLIRGNGATHTNQNVNTLGIVSNSSLLRSITNGIGVNFSSFNLSPSSANTVSVKSGSPAAGISLDMTPLTGTGLLYRLSIKSTSGDFVTAEGRIDFVGTPTAAQRAAHLATHLNTSFGTLGVSASISASTSVRVSMAGAAYGGIVVAGI